MEPSDLRDYRTGNFSSFLDNINNDFPSSFPLLVTGHSKLTGVHGTPTCLPQPTLMEPLAFILSNPPTNLAPLPQRLRPPPTLMMSSTLSSNHNSKGNNNPRYLFISLLNGCADPFPLLLGLEASWLAPRIWRVWMGKIRAEL